MASEKKDSRILIQENFVNSKQRKLIPFTDEVR